ncbi:MAG: hypothetical protein E6J63_23550 [Deltaproteobacteria bacterium]|nr:MAG: hypothetical protein E6J63_23550 [Deltaproteobacteria bacterium]
MRLALLTLLAAAPVMAFDAFEIQVYDGTADQQGQAGLEVHLIRPRAGTFNVTFEPSYGVLPFWELGGYLQTSDGRYEGAKLRTKFVIPEGWHPNWRLGLNAELARIPNEGWGGEIRPIIAWENERFLFAANPNVGFPLSFDPGAMGKLKLGPIAAGIEYYASLADGEHYLFQAVDLLALKDVEVNAAVGEGLTSSSQSLIFKMILGYAF